jgi:cyclase
MRIRRTALEASLCILCGSILFAASSARAQDGQDFSKVQIKVTHVAADVYLLQGAGGNIAASVGEDGIVLVDDEYAPLAEKVRAALHSIGATGKPVRFVINTHYHDDHTGGNLDFSSTSTVIAQDNVRKRLEEGGRGGNGGSVHFDLAPAPKGALPIITFDHDLTVHVNGEDIRAMHLPHGHTDGDSIIYFPKANVVHMGDDYVRYGFPFIDIDAGGSAQGMIAAMEEVIAQLPPDVKVIPGHGELATLDDVRAYLTMLKETTAAVRKALQEGKTLDQMKQEKILDPWKKLSNDFISENAYLESLYNSLTGQPSHMFLRHD